MAGDITVTRAEWRARATGLCAAAAYVALIGAWAVPAVVFHTVSLSAPFVLTLPWSLALPIFNLFTWGALGVGALMAVFGLVNAAIIYFLVKALARSLFWGAIAGMFAGVLLACCAAWFIDSQEKANLVRIVNGGSERGVWVATGEDGLRAMRANRRTSPGLVFLPNGTKGVWKAQRFLLESGRLVEPYPANSYDMVRDGALEVEKIQVTEGPQKGLEGWIPSERLQRIGSIFAL
jgi:hypothetical protein